jgi:hypothetical protein
VDEVKEERRAVRDALVVVAWQSCLEDLLGAPPSNETIAAWAHEAPGEWLSLLILLLWWLNGQPDLQQLATVPVFSPEIVRFADRFAIEMLEIEANYGEL